MLIQRFREQKVSYTADNNIGNYSTYRSSTCTRIGSRPLPLLLCILGLDYFDFSRYSDDICNVTVAINTLLDLWSI